jgi:hypothetical protein
MRPHRALRRREPRERHVPNDHAMKRARPHAESKAGPRSKAYAGPESRTYDPVKRAGVERRGVGRSMCSRVCRGMRGRMSHRAFRKQRRCEARAREKRGGEGNSKDFMHGARTCLLVLFVE